MSHHLRSGADLQRVDADNTHDRCRQIGRYRNVDGCLAVGDRDGTRYAKLAGGVVGIEIGLRERLNLLGRHAAGRADGESGRVQRRSKPRLDDVGARNIDGRAGRGGYGDQGNREDHCEIAPAVGRPSTYETAQKPECPRIGGVALCGCVHLNHLNGITRQTQRNHCPGA